MVLIQINRICILHNDRKLSATNRICFLMQYVKIIVNSIRKSYSSVHLVGTEDITDLKPSMPSNA